MKYKIFTYAAALLIFLFFSCQGETKPTAQNSVTIPAKTKKPQQKQSPKKIPVCSILNQAAIEKAIGKSISQLNTKQSNQDVSSSICEMSWVDKGTTNNVKLGIYSKPPKEKRANWSQEYYKKLKNEGLKIGNQTFKYRAVNIDNSNDAIWSDNQHRMLCRIGNEYIISVNLVQPSSYKIKDAKNITLAVIKNHFSK